MPAHGLLGSECTEKYAVIISGCRVHCQRKDLIIVETIVKALQNHPALAALTIFIFGLSMAFTAIGIAIPELWTLMVQVLCIIMMFMGIMYLCIINRKGKASAAPFGLPRLTILLGIRLQWGSQMSQRGMTWAAI